MARVKNTISIIENTKGKINTYYDASIQNFIDIRDYSKGTFDLISNSFVFGYAQGMKAAKTEFFRRA